MLCLLPLEALLGWNIGETLIYLDTWEALLRRKKVKALLGMNIYQTFTYLVRGGSSLGKYGSSYCIYGRCVRFLGDMGHIITFMLAREQFFEGTTVKLLHIWSLGGSSWGKV